MGNKVKHLTVIEYVAEQIRAHCNKLITECSLTIITPEVLDKYTEGIWMTEGHIPISKLNINLSDEGEKAVTNKQKAINNAESGLGAAEFWAEYAERQLEKVKDKEGVKQAREIKEKARNAKERISKLSSSQKQG